MNNFTVPWRVFLLTVLATLASVNAFGLEKKYYYKISVSCATGEGSVYASPDKSTPSDGVYKDNYTTTTNDSVIYLFAKPQSGYAFEKWTSGGETYTDNPQRIIYSEKVDDESKAFAHEFVASFVKADVSVVSENTAFGSVSIDKAENVVNNEVTLTAKPYNNTFNGCALDGWYKDGNFISNENPYTFTITDGNKGVYTAKFRRSNGYFRLKNATTGRYAHMVGTKYRQTNRDDDGYVGIACEGSVEMASQVDLSDPSFIVRIDGTENGTGLTNTDFLCQGVSLKDSIFARDIPNVDIATNKVGDDYTFSYYYGGNYRYLKDGAGFGYNSAVVCGGEDTHKWELEPVMSIGIKADVVIGQTYYTTLYVPFPFICGENVTPYYVVKYEDSWDLEPIDTKTIPALTPVLLESKSSSANITPVFENSSLTFDKTNLLNGFIKLNDKVQTGYVLGVQNGDLEFVYTDNVKSNRAYIKPEVLGKPVPAKKFNVTETTGVKSVKVNDKVSTNGTFDISGRKIIDGSSPTKAGLYIVDGKKIIIR